jgi:hypothetical protein
MVRALSQHLGYPIARRRIHGTRYILDDSGALTRQMMPHVERPITYGPGKSECIRQYLPAPPILVAGDSDGDFDMLVDFDTEVRLMINANRQGKIAALCATARQGATEGLPLHLLQGYDLKTGAFHDSQETFAGARVERAA